MVCLDRVCLEVLVMVFEIMIGSCLLWVLNIFLIVYSVVLVLRVLKIVFIMRVLVLLLMRFLMVLW